MIGTRRKAYAVDYRRWLVLVMILLMPLSGCESSRQSSPSSLSDNGRFMDLWNTYIRCSQGEDLETIRTDAQRLSDMTHTTHSDAASILPEIYDPFRVGPTVRLSSDPAAMAAACALHTGQVAQEMGRLYVAREMFRMVVLRFPEPRYQYYAAQARLGIERLDVARRLCRKLPHLIRRCQHDI